MRAILCPGSNQWYISKRADEKSWVVLTDDRTVIDLNQCHERLTYNYSLMHTNAVSLLSASCTLQFSSISMGAYIWTYMSMLRLSIPCELLVKWHTASCSAATRRYTRATSLVFEQQSVGLKCFLRNDMTPIQSTSPGDNWVAATNLKCHVTCWKPNELRFIFA